MKKTIRLNQVRHRRSVTHSVALEKLEYNPETGLLKWRQGPRRGDVAGTPLKDGYVLVRLAGNNFAAARLVWFIVHGQWPDHEVDHVNGDPSDNRLSNLRLATRSQNNRNRGTPRNNTSGVKGVAFHIGAGAWVAYIRAGGRRIHLGTFAKKEEAVAVRTDAEARLYGDFARQVPAYGFEDCRE